jgi:hypothetical protein
MRTPDHVFVALFFCSLETLRQRAGAVLQAGAAARSRPCEKRLGRVSVQSRDRNAIYGYLTAVFDLVMWWAAEDREISRARWALQLQHVDLAANDEPFAAVILCTADREKVDKRTRSKWSRMMRYVAEYKTNSEPLAVFVQRKGGINKCAARFTRCGGRHSVMDQER